MGKFIVRVRDVAKPVGREYRVWASDPVGAMQRGVERASRVEGCTGYFLRVEGCRRDARR